MKGAFVSFVDVWFKFLQEVLTGGEAASAVGSQWHYCTRDSHSSF